MSVLESQRQPVHVFYGGAQIFKPDTSAKMGKIALRALEENAPDAAAFAKVFGWSDSARADRILERVKEKLRNEPIEDLRIDFEDGYGYRPDSEEDAHAAAAARDMAKALAAGALPPFCGIRIKALNDECSGRAFKTLGIFLEGLLKATQGELPRNFVVTLPKITSADQVTILAGDLARIEAQSGLATGSIGIELMIETARSILSFDGNCAIPALVAAGSGRVRAAHFGAYDYTAELGITAANQQLSNPACDFARQMMQVSLAGTGVRVSDGATNLFPVGADREDVYRGWRLSYANIRRALEQGIYQGWDLHPAQLPVRYAALYSFFLEQAEATGARLRAFLKKAAQATLSGSVFDDAASGQGLLNFFFRALLCGAISEEEALSATGLSREELQLRSFPAILAARSGRASP